MDPETTERRRVCSGVRVAMVRPPKLWVVDPDETAAMISVERDSSLEKSSSFQMAAVYE